MPVKKHKRLSIFDWHSLEPFPVIGVDEVGRGCLAGDVYAAAVIIDKDRCSLRKIKQYTDSKLLSEKRREELSEEILSLHKVSIAFATVEEINKINIFHASMLAMRRAIEGLKVEIGHVIVDGNQKVPGIKWPQTTVIKGDLRASPISAASIVAKVARDRYMVNLAKEYPGYEFEKHKGYSTKEHKQCIVDRGPTRIHRKYFTGVRQHWGECLGQLEMGTDL